MEPWMDEVPESALHARASSWWQMPGLRACSSCQPVSEQRCCAGVWMQALPAACLACTLLRPTVRRQSLTWPCWELPCAALQRWPRHGVPAQGWPPGAGWPAQQQQQPSGMTTEPAPWAPAAVARRAGALTSPHCSAPAHAAERAQPRHTSRAGVRQGGRPQPHLDGASPCARRQATGGHIAEHLQAVCKRTGAPVSSFVVGPAAPGSGLAPSSMRGLPSGWGCDTAASVAQQAAALQLCR